MRKTKPLPVAVTAVAMLFLTSCVGTGDSSNEATALDGSGAIASPPELTDGGIAVPDPTENSAHGYNTDPNNVQTLQSCDDWRVFWRFQGPAVSFAVSEKVSDIAVVATSTEIYLANQHLDLNRDGILCFYEDENLEEVRQSVLYSPKTSISDASSLQAIENCRIKNLEGGSGFPRRFPDLVGKFVAQVIYVEAPDASGTTEPVKDFGYWENDLKQFLESMSYGKLSLEFRVSDEYFTLNKAFRDYTKGEGRWNPTEFSKDVVALVDDEINFSGVDMVLIVAPPTADEGDFIPFALPIPIEDAISSDEEELFRFTGVGTMMRKDVGYLEIGHEIGHLFGLEDYYWHDFFVGDWDINRSHEGVKFMGVFDGMSTAAGGGARPEWSAWSRWLLGYLDESQVRCVSEKPKSTHILTAISEANDLPKMAVLPLSEGKAIVAESRKKLGYDENSNPLYQGLLVYVVDTSITNGQGPLRVVRKSNLQSRELDDAALTPGESVEISGYRVSNLESSDLWDVVEFSKIP